MNDGLLFRVGDLLGLDAPCDNLSRAEQEDLVEGRLGPERLAEFEAHASVCASCGELLEDLQRYRNLVATGLTIPSERNAFDGTDAAVRRKLGLGGAARRGRRGLFSWITPLWLTPALATVVLLVLWLWPARPLLIASVEPVPLQPPPTVRGLALERTWERLEGPWRADDMQGAARILEPAAQAHPERVDLWFYLGVARLRSGDAAGAVEALLEADRLEASAPSENTRWMLAAALERTGRVEQACAALRSVAEIGGVRAGAARAITDRACPRSQSAP